MHGKTIVMVGCAAGTTRLTAETLASEGARLFISASSDADLQVALNAARQVGGEADGQVVDWSSRSAIGNFFDTAEDRYGQIHALVNFFALENESFDVQAEDCQSACLQEAILRMQGEKHCQIINVGQSKSAQGGRSFTAALRRQAKELGIRVTLIEPGAAVSGAYQAEAIAQCVLDSLVQPYKVDIIFLPQLEDQPR